MDIPRANILGVGVSAINMEVALHTIDRWIGQREPHYICVTNVHGVMESQRDEKLRQIHNSAGLVTPEGMPLVWLTRLKGFSQVGRVHGPSLMLAVCEHSVQKGYRHFLYGGLEGVPELLAEELTRRFPGLVIAGTFSPPFRPLTREEDYYVVQMINDSDADIVWVALGAPKQERWIADHVGKVTAPVLISVGYAFDAHSGRKKLAPRWMQRSALEWLFRLTQEPRRLWYRYLIYNPLFVLYVVAQALGLRKYEIEPAIYQQQ